MLIKKILEPNTNCSNTSTNKIVLRSFVNRLTFMHLSRSRKSFTYPSLDNFWVQEHQTDDPFKSIKLRQCDTGNQTSQNVMLSK
jgi:hypothetical protein